MNPIDLYRVKLKASLQNRVSLRVKSYTYFNTDIYITFHQGEDEIFRYKLKDVPKKMKQGVTVDQLTGSILSQLKNHIFNKIFV